MRYVRGVVSLGLLMVLAGCATPLSTREKGTSSPSVLARSGDRNASGHTAAGALIGAGVGAVSGALIGDSMQANEQRQAAPPPPPQPPPPPPAVVAPPPPPPPPVAVVAPPPVVVASPQYVWVPQLGVYVLEGHDVITMVATTTMCTVTAGTCPGRIEDPGPWWKCGRRSCTVCRMAISISTCRRGWKKRPKFRRAIGTENPCSGPPPSRGKETRQTAQGEAREKRGNTATTISLNPRKPFYRQGATGVRQGRQGLRRRNSGPVASMQVVGF